MHLSVLDQSPVLAGASAAEALAATLELAQAADRLGFHRYWVAEHHAMAAVADPCPEILVGRIASLTQRIRVGTGGILLPYYSPLKVAESFRMLEALFPGRIDLGVGRAPGGDMRTAQALLRGGARFDPGAFPGQIEALREYLAGGETDGVYATPAADTIPQLWLLGSSSYSGRLAAQLGLPYAFAHFISDAECAVANRSYRSGHAGPDRPHSLLAVFATCADTEEQARRLSMPVAIWRLLIRQGVNAPLVTLSDQQIDALSPLERAQVDQQLEQMVIGTPQQVRDRLQALAARYEADELMVVSITRDYPSRLRCYELLAEAWGLPERT